MNQAAIVSGPVSTLAETAIYQASETLSVNTISPAVLLTEPPSPITGRSRVAWQQIGPHEAHRVARHLLVASAKDFTGRPSTSTPKITCRVDPHYASGINVQVNEGEDLVAAAEAVLTDFPASSLASRRKRIILDTQHWENAFRPSFTELRNLYALADGHGITISLRTSTLNFYFQEIRPRKLIPVDFRKGSLQAAGETAVLEKTDRPYQVEAREAVVGHTDNGGRRGLVVMPTGTGKTYTFRKILAELATKPRFDGKKILVVAHQDQIMEQNALELAEEFGIDNIGLVQGDAREWDKTVVVATVQSLLSNADDFPWEEFGICVLDEAHHYVESNEWFEVVRRFETDDEKYVLGVTATPDRLSGDPLVNVYGANLLYCRDIDYFIRHGYLLNPVGKTLHLERQDRAGNLLTARETWKALSMDEKAEIVYRALTDAEVNAGFEETRAVVFLSSKAEVRGITSRLNHKYEVAAVDIVDDSPDRSARFNDFRNGKYRVLLGVNAISEGVDVPSANRAFLFRDSESRATIAQQVGRILRPDPEDVTRTDALVVDGMGVLAKHHIQVKAEEAYTCGKEAIAIRKAESEAPEIQKAKELASVAIVTTRDLGNLIIEKNHFAEILQELIADTDHVIRLSYSLGMSSDELMNWYFGSSIPQSEKQARALAALLGGDTEKVVTVYKETEGDAIRRYLIQKLIQRARELGRTPRSYEMHGSYPGFSTYFKYFESWNTALGQAGLVEVEMTRTDAISILQAAKKKFDNANPRLSVMSAVSYDNIAKTEGWPDSRMIAVLVTGNSNGWNEAKEAAGLQIKIQVSTSSVDVRRVLLEAQKIYAGKHPSRLLTGEAYDAMAKEHSDWPRSWATVAIALTGSRSWKKALVATGVRNADISHDQAKAILRKAQEIFSQSNPHALISEEAYSVLAQQQGWVNSHALAQIITGDGRDWTQARRMAGVVLEITRDSAIEILVEAEKINRETNSGATLSIESYETLRAGRDAWPSVSLLSRVLAGDDKKWAEAKRQAGLAIGYQKRWTKETAIQILIDAQRIHEIQHPGTVITASQYDVMRDSHDDNWPAWATLTQMITGGRRNWREALAIAKILK